VTEFGVIATLVVRWLRGVFRQPRDPWLSAHAKRLQFNIRGFPLHEAVWAIGCGLPEKPSCFVFHSLRQRKLSAVKNRLADLPLLLWGVRIMSAPSELPRIDAFGAIQDRCRGVVRAVTGLNGE
jgi:hypothetical protein